MVEGPGSLSELQKLNRIQERLLVEYPSSKEEKKLSTLTATTRSKIGRVRFANQPPREQVDTPSCSITHQDKNHQAPVLFEEADMRDEFEKATRRSVTRRVPKHPKKAPRHREPPDIPDIDPLVVQAELKERIPTAQDEEEK